MFSYTGQYIGGRGRAYGHGHVLFLVLKPWISSLLLLTLVPHIFISPFLHHGSSHAPNDHADDGHHKKTKNEVHATSHTVHHADTPYIWKEKKKHGENEDEHADHGEHTEEEEAVEEQWPTQYFAPPHSTRTNYLLLKKMNLFHVLHNKGFKGVLFVKISLKNPKPIYQY